MFGRSPLKSTLHTLPALEPVHEPSYHPPSPAPGATGATPNTRQLEQALRDARAELHEVRTRLDRTLAELQQARRELDGVEDAKERFLSSVSHELRTPLSAILLWTTLVEEEKLEDPEQLREAIDTIRRSAEEQQALIENLVNTSRIVAGRLRLDRRAAEILPVVRAALESVAPAAQKKQLILTSKAAPENLAAPVDRDRLQQALTHLLLNAVKFTAAGGRIDVAVRAAGGELEIAVTDTGQGIAPERLPRLFGGPVGDRRKAPRTEAGLGYGLLVSRRLAEAHGGALTAHSPGPDRGATFTLRIPLDASRRVAPAAARAPALPLAGRTVLLVIDEPDTRRALTDGLADAGAHVASVDCAPAAWESFESRRPDAIVCDLALPTIDACDFLNDIRRAEAEAGAAPAPAIGLAAVENAPEIARAHQCGFHRSFVAPFDPQQLVEELRARLASRVRPPA